MHSYTYGRPLSLIRAHSHAWERDRENERTEVEREGRESKGREKQRDVKTERREIVR